MILVSMEITIAHCIAVYIPAHKRDPAFVVDRPCDRNIQQAVYSAICSISLANPNQSIFLFRTRHNSPANRVLTLKQLQKSSVFV
jgi:hypothetical protein